MSGLDLLANYSSDSDDCNDDFEHSENCSDELSKAESIVENKKLPLPAIFAAKTVDSEHLDEPGEHDGRIRTFAHERGNWATYVYILYITSSEFIDLVGSLQTVCNSVATFHTQQEFHLSVSKTFVLRFHWINTFISSLRDALKDIPKFSIRFEKINIYTNDDHSRTFVACEINVGDENLKNIVGVIDKILKEFSLPVFYDNPSFHISILWCLGNKKKELVELLPRLQSILDEEIQTATEFADEEPLHDIYVENLICKTGNKVFNFNLI